MPKKTKKTRTTKRKSKFDRIKAKIEVRRSRTGLGLYTFTPIAKGACIIEYVGRELTEKQVDKSNSKYLFELTKTRTIDGARRSNRARYINHSCRPNCEIDIWRGRIYVMARRGIKEGEELTYDYGKDYMDTFIKPNGGCRCPKCKPPRNPKALLKVAKRRGSRSRRASV